MDRAREVWVRLTLRPLSAEAPPTGRALTSEPRWDEDRVAEFVPGISGARDGEDFDRDAGGGAARRGATGICRRCPDAGAASAGQGSAPRPSAPAGTRRRL